MNELKTFITRLHKEKYPDADIIFLAGSVIRGEGTKTSDLDLVVIYDSLPNAYRDSYNYGGWPVEAFVHDPQTLEYFIRKVDAPSGVPSLAAMVSEGIELPSPTGLSQRLKQLANEAFQAGPPRWTATDVDNSRYLISDLIEDLREPRTPCEMYAIASQLFTAISNHYFRSQG
ncbi:MAG: nucleotidyltransferase domain-containing protein [Gammaproteobacteria bacterium]|nr:nucleotidyltransferase domain-containing protein [Gammaproteobacteria bacterium]